MKRNLLALPLLVLLYGCVSVKYNYQPQRINISEPPLNAVVTAYIGDSMLRQGEYIEYDAIYLPRKAKIGTIESYTFTPGHYVKKGEDEKSEFYLPMGGPDSGQVIVGSLADPFQVIRIDKKSEKLCSVSTYNMEVCSSNVNYEKKKLSVINSDSFQQTLIYSGQVGNKINIGYREFSGNVARPAFNNEVEYDLSESKIIGYKGARIEVIEANNESIKYKVIKNFNLAKY